MIKLTKRQAKMLAKKADGPFSCDISARECEAPFFGLSTVFMLNGNVWIVGPSGWVGPARNLRTI